MEVIRRRAEAAPVSTCGAEGGVCGPPILHPAHVCANCRPASRGDDGARWR